jgi:hypothetical protein
VLDCSKITKCHLPSLFVYAIIDMQRQFMYSIYDICPNAKKKVEKQKSRVNFTIELLQWNLAFRKESKLQKARRDYNV